jgi:drug/metabolite transporter (DMT)-like permease
VRPFAGPAWDRDLRVKIVLAFAAVYIIYGAIYLALKVMVENHIPPIAASGARYALAGSALLAVLRLRGKQVKPDRRTFWRTGLLGMLLLVPYGFVALAERDISSGLASLLLAAVPIFVVLLRVAADRERLPGAVLVGVVIGFGGVALLTFGHGESADGTLLATTITLLAAVAVAVGSFIVARLPVSIDAFPSAGWQLMWAGAVLLVVGGLSGEIAGFEPARVGSDGVLAFVLLVTLGTIPPYASYIWLLERVPVSQVATTNYVNPLVAVFLGWLVLDEVVGGVTLLGGGLILLSVMLVVTRDR